jgi:O-antigen/teichoic acid export membrane protein
VKSLWSSPTLRSVVIYGASGLGFAGANLILARSLPPNEYGRFTLVIALINLSFALAPIGVDGIVLRRHLEVEPALLTRTLGAGLIIGTISLLIAGFAYHLSTLYLLLVFAATVGGGAMAVAGAKFQSEQRYAISLALTQSPNLVLIVAALAVMVSNVRQAELPLGITSLGFVGAGVVGWWILFQERGKDEHQSAGFPWYEAVSFAGMNAAGLLLIQLDRLIIPHVLPLHDLATFGVLAAIAGSLFRVLSMGIGYTLVPRLRAAATVMERRRLIAHEAKLVGLIVLSGSLFIWFLTPVIEHWFLAGKYHLGSSLIVATLFSGVAKILNSFTKSTVTALASGTEILIVNVLGWLSVAVAIGAGASGARWGLAGVIYGVGLGWLTRAISASFLTLRHLRLPATVAVPAQ